MTDSAPSHEQAFKLKGTMPALTMLCLQTDDVASIERQLAEHIAQMPQFFLHAPVMLDLESVKERDIDFGRLAQVLRERRLVPVAVRNPTDAQKERAVVAGWGVLQASLVRPNRPSAPQDGERSATAPARPRPEGNAIETRPAGLTVRQPVRSGQVVYASGGDLVVLAPVSSGAELIADGNIHVYAPFRGRALAGAHDNAEASIFCTSLEAEFLSIAGRHLMSDDIPKEHRGKPARVHLDDDQLVITRL